VKFSESASLFSEKFPDIANSIIKLIEDESLQKTLSQAGTIGGLINIGFAIFNKIRSELKKPEELAFASFIKVIFESARNSVPSEIINLSSINSQIKMEDILELFLSNYISNYYYLPDHPAAKQFKNKIIQLMKENDSSNEDIHHFVVNFNSTLLINAKNSKLEELLNSWELKATNDKLIKYLAYLTSLLDEPNPVDDRAVSEYYIENKMIVIEKKSWQYSIDDISRFEQKEWKFENFIDSTKKREFVGAEFGTGKTNFAKKIAVGSAIKYLRGKNTYVPIYVPLKRNLNNIFYDDGLEDIITIVGDQKVLLICDGLDEYEDDPNTLIYTKLPNMFKKGNEVKTIFTTRLEPDLPNKIDISGDYYVRLFPFTHDQVNEFFSGSKYNLPDVTYDTLEEFGLDEGEISKPLLCWMFAIMYSNPDSDLSIRNIPSLSIKRALFFQEVIHSIIVGKHKDSTDGKDKESLYKVEKKLLRNLAYLTSIYKDNLTTKIVADKLRLNDAEVLQNPIITTYFNLLATKDKPRKIEFFHKSFFEYLLAESFIEYYLNGHIGRLDADIPTHETMLFFEGLLEIVDKFDPSMEKNLPFSLPDSLDVPLTITEIKKKLLKSAKDGFDDEIMNFFLYNDLPTVMYENLIIHRWISIFVMNKVKNTFQIEREKFFRLVRFSSNFIPEYLQRIENIDLSNSKIIGDDLGLNSNLSKAQLHNSTLVGNFNGTKFVGSDLTDSTIELRSKFIGTDFSGANLTNLMSKYNDDSRYSAEFVGCDFFETKFINGKINNYDFKACDFKDADFSDAELGSNFLACRLSSVKTTQKTTAKGLTLCGESFSEVHTRPLSSNKKQLINMTLEDIDTDLRKIILRDNQNFPS
jgi:uncharacterized protein YjbI with pentapeptide repeats